MSNSKSTASASSTNLRQPPFHSHPAMPYVKNRMRSSSSSSSSIPIPSLPFLFFFVIFCTLLTLSRSSCVCSEYDHPSMTSQGFQNTVEIDALARFALDEHNMKQNALLEFGRVVEAMQQVAQQQPIAGTMLYLTLEAIDGGENKIYEARLWVKSWINYKELQEFKEAADHHKQGWQSVPIDDPQVQDAANHAIKTIQPRSNSLVPYQLHEVADAKAEFIDDAAKFNMLLKLKRGEKEEKFKVTQE